MDDWTYPYADVEVLDTQPPLLNEDGRVLEARRARAQRAEAARVTELEQTQDVDVVGFNAGRTSRLSRSRRRPVPR